MKTPRVALLGAGAWGQNLVRTLHHLGALAAVAEPVEALRARASEIAPGVPVVADHGRLLRGDIDAVAIATPAPTHFALAREALLAGKDVFVEKPITLRSVEAEELAGIAEKEGRIAMVGHLLLYDPAIAWLRGKLAAGAIGEVAFLHQERLKLGRARSGENVLWSFGVHDIAVLLHLVGEEPSRVAAAGQRVLQPSIDDDVHVHLAFPGGARAHLHVSWLWPETRRTLTIVGRSGMFVYDEVAGTVTLHRKSIDAKLEAHDEGHEIVFRSPGEPLTAEMRHFLDCVRTREQPRTPARDGARVVRVLEQAEANR